jgi:4-hydroxy-tetrahydrodipicolinate synthase
MRAIYDAHQAGDQERARQLDAELAPIFEALTVTANPIPVKTALELMGMIPGHLRLPMVPADAEQRAAVRGALEARGLLSAAGAA